MNTIKTLHVGLGPIGQRIVEYASERPGLEVVGAVDPAAEKAGRDLGELCGLGRPLGIRVAPDLSSALATCRPNAAVLSTTSSLAAVVPQLEDLLARRLAVVSTCEELSYPWTTSPELARRIDQAARQAGVAVLGTGVNPGFLMDILPLVLSAVCRRVQRVKVSRIQDASIRRGPFQQKIGAGLTPEQFEEKRQAGTLRHVGLTESMQMIAARFGWSLDRTEDLLSPVIAERQITTGYVPIHPGMAAGVQQVGRGWRGSELLVELYFRAAVGEPEPADTVEILGTPAFKSVIPGGIHGDVATCAIVTNALASIVAAPPGLRTMADMPPVTYFSGP